MDRLNINLSLNPETCNISIQNNNKDSKNITCFDLDFLHHITNNINKIIHETPIPILDNINEQYQKIIEAIEKYGILKLNEEINNTQNGSGNQKKRRSSKKIIKESDLLKLTSCPKYSKYSKYFAPKAPKDWKTKKREPLDTLQILNACKQFEQAYPDFQFLDVTPRNYKDYVNGDYVSREIATFNPEEYMKQGKQRFGMVMNTDTHNNDGEHWVCSFVDCRDTKWRGIYYYDSYALHPDGEFLDLFRDISSKMGGMRVMFNSRRHQRKNSECGMFCIHFINSMLQNNSKFDHVTRDMPNDDEINEKRSQYFNF
jgi:hypothetical protein